MSKIYAAEWLLTRFTAPPRAVAIMGDLTELSSGRGRLWFYAAYARTLVSLGWRTVVALAGGVFAFNLFRVLIGTWIFHTPAAWHTAFHTAPAMLNGAIAYSAISLWFSVPYYMSRYGSGTRFIRLAVLFTLFMTAAFLHIPSISTASLGLAIALLAGAVATAEWRRAGVALATIVAVGTALYWASASFAVLSLDYASERLPHDLSAFRYTGWIVWAIIVSTPMLVMPLVCSRARGLLLLSSQRRCAHA